VKRRTFAVAAMSAALLFLPLPAAAQDGGSSVSFDGVGFAFDATLGESVNITRVPGQPADLEQPGGPDLPHVTFTLYGSRAEGARVPRVGFAPGVVRTYGMEDIARYDEASAQLEALQALLAERPNLDRFMEVDDGFGGERLPHLPVDTAAAQALRARATYVDTPQVSGVAYVAAYRQDVAPFVAGDFWYTFQGLSADGAWYVAVDFVVEAGMFPERVGLRQMDRVADRWVEYLAESTQTLNDAAPDAFTPSLASVDALVQTITFEGILATEPSPLPTGG
jgi:hypothetical protein